MAKSILLSVGVGVVVGIFLSLRAWAKGAPVDVAFTLAVCVVSVLACFLLSFRDYFQAKSNAEDRELKELEGKSDPLIEVVNAEKNLSFRRKFGTTRFDAFEVNWVVNQTTMDLNTSILSVTMVKPIGSEDAKREINRIAKHYCGGTFLRTQTVGVIIRGADSVLQAKPLVAKSFLASSGIIWALCINDNERVVDAFKTPYQVKTDQIYLNLVGWFRDSGYTIAAEPERRRNPVFD